VLPIETQKSIIVQPLLRFAPLRPLTPRLTASSSSDVLLAAHFPLRLN
jgi:hypothetical protein